VAATPIAVVPLIAPPCSATACRSATPEMSTSSPRHAARRYRREAGRAARREAE